jgi:hypothetical protein
MEKLMVAKQKLEVELEEKDEEIAEMRPLITKRELQNDRLKEQNLDLV